MINPVPPGLMVYGEMTFTLLNLWVLPFKWNLLRWTFANCFLFLRFYKKKSELLFFLFFFLCKPFLLFYCWLKGQKHFRLVFFFYPMWCQTELVLKIWLPLKGLVHDNAHARRLSLQNKFVGSTLNSKSPLPVQSLKILRFIRTSVALAGLVILR